MAELTEEQIKEILKFIGQQTWGEDIQVYDESWRDMAATVGTNNHPMAQVEEGWLRVITHMAAYNDVSACDFIYLQHWNGRELVEDEGQVAPAIGEVVAFNGMLILGPGKYEAVSFEGCTSGDDLYFVAHGYSIYLGRR